jgi:hypothetical protein
VAFGVTFEEHEAFFPIKIGIEIVEPGHTEDQVKFAKWSGYKINCVVIGIDR